MATVQFRFYEELNEFLPTRLRKRSFRHHCARRATVKQAFEALGVPHTEVELVLVDGGSVDFSHIVREGERISVYPQFESIDVSPLLKVRERPLRETRFIVDSHFGALARYLRMLGFDALYESDWEDRRIAEIAQRERRVVLTRDRDLLMRGAITHGCYVRGVRPRAQLEEVVSRLDLKGSCAPFTRCMECNTKLDAVARSRIAARLPAGTARFYDRFSTCPGCRKIYWRGSHYRAMCQLIAALGIPARAPEPVAPNDTAGSRPD